jgi:hypothetical protein
VDVIDLPGAVVAAWSFQAPLQQLIDLRFPGCLIDTGGGFQIPQLLAGGRAILRLVSLEQGQRERVLGAKPIIAAGRSRRITFCHCATASWRDSGSSLSKSSCA